MACNRWGSTLVSLCFLKVGNPEVGATALPKVPETSPNEGNTKSLDEASHPERVVSGLNDPFLISASIARYARSGALSSSRL